MAARNLSFTSAIIMIAELDRYLLYAMYTIRAYCKYDTSRQQEGGCLCFHR